MRTVIDILAGIGAFCLAMTALFIAYLLTVRHNEAAIERTMAAFEEELRDEDDEHDKREREL
jgi:site-specific DNA-cytosine methylase